MSVPPWVLGNSPRGRPATSLFTGSGRSTPRSSDSRKRQEESTPEQRKAKLGRTSGLMAVGAWSARMEIAKMIEEGVASTDILAAIMEGQESEEPLEQRALPWQRGVSQTAGLERALRTPRSVPSPLTETGEKSRESLRSPGGAPGSASRRSSDLVAVPSGGDRHSGEPAWTTGSRVALPFSKKASGPPSVESPTSPADSPELSPPPGDWRPPSPEVPTVPEEVGTFRKRAVAPPPDSPGREKTPPKVQKKRPTRTNPLELEKRSQFGKLCLQLFEELVILKVKMYLVREVADTITSLVDEEKFAALTEPRAAGTGLRYARLMMRFLEYLTEGGGEERDPEDFFGISSIYSYVLHLISQGVGFMTPLSFLYAVEHFSTLFRFEAPGSRHPRARKFALDYSKRAPEKNQAPLFSVAFLSYLERAVLDESKKVEHRIVLGKLRLCTQASIRHSDLASTALERVEWCRVVGESSVLGLRARASKTKSGPRPWAAAWLGVDPSNDRWMFVLAELILKSHGSSWKSHNFFGCASDGKGSFAACPPCIGEDVILAKQAILDDLESGKSVPLTEAQAKSLRWHSCKNTLPTLMTHFGIKTRTIRHQGAWKKADESMVDLYLREAQVLVIKAQLEVLDQIRRGVTMKVLDGQSLDLIPMQEPCWEPAEGFNRTIRSPRRGSDAESRRSHGQSGDLCGRLGVRPG